MNLKRIVLTIVCVLTTALMTACGTVPEEEAEPAIENKLPAVTEEMVSTEVETETETAPETETAAEESSAETEPETEAFAESETEAFVEPETIGDASADAAVPQGEYSILGAWRCDDLEFPLLMLFGEQRKLSMLACTDKVFLEQMLELQSLFEDEENGLLTDITRDEDADNFRIYSVNREFSEEIPELGENVVNLDVCYILDKNEDLYVLTQGLYGYSYEVAPGFLILYDDMWGGDAEAMELEFVDSNTFCLTAEEEETMRFVRTAHLDALANYLDE